MYISSTALLPSTFSMYMTMVFLFAWWNKKFKLAILSIVISSLIGWPFAALISISFLYEILIQRRLFMLFIKWSVLFAIIVGAPMLIVDSYIYGKTTFAPLNIILYNVFSSHGPNLFGVESRYFYLINLFLNFNIAWCFALSFPLTAVMVNFKKPSKLPTNGFGFAALFKTLPLYIWLFVFFIQPHKEERFMFPVYPVISLCGALGASNCIKWMSQKINVSFRNLIVGALGLYTILSISRITALYFNYHAPMDLPAYVNESSVVQNMCYGKEWHRSPGSFFLPLNYRLSFIKSNFNGILPAYYKEGQDGARVIHSYFNDKNVAHDHMLFDYSKCDYLIDLDLGDEYDPKNAEPNYSLDIETWEVVNTIKFLDVNNSWRLFRAFHLPMIGSSKLHFRNYNLLKRKSKLG
ncbi:alpha-1,2-mannosyltransferase ALG9 isoform X2 [Wyeomyia smithii]|nr:alpha-1,2-mannosyltransferase ALG9 isoform X2 [Wyeomyia smithii]